MRAAPNTVGGVPSRRRYHPTSCVGDLQPAFNPSVRSCRMTADMLV
jgi:hypothetical protein